MIPASALHALISGNQRLLGITRRRIAASRRLLNPAFGLSGGRVSPEEDALRLSIRERLATGGLFWASGHSHMRRGTGRPCDVCGKPIGNDSLEREVIGPRNTRTAISHEACWTIWREVCREMQRS
ncbi:MAG TPA: hypothetical protein VF197_16240 [Methylomirabilota bacterium]